MRELLEAGLEKLGLQTSRQLCENYFTYIELLSKWNKAYNLTAIKGEEAMLNRHVLDSLSVHSYIEGERCLDVGTGAGLPGLILALAQPEKKWVLLDSNQKKLRFIQHVKTVLGITNIEIVHARVETYQVEQTFDTVICRAFTSMDNYIALVQHLCKTNACVLAMKGAKVDEEHDSIKSLCKSSETIILDVPGSDGQRALIKARF